MQLVRSNRKGKKLHIVNLSQVPDIRLIACDMDGTLLDDSGLIHDEFWPLIELLHDRGITFCPASGRQYYSLLERFKPISAEVIFIAENGTYVIQNGREISSSCLTKASTNNAIQIARNLRSTETDVGIVLCGKRSAYIEHTEPIFQEEVDKYYLRVEFVNNLLSVEDEFLKVAIFNFDSAERVTYPAFSGVQDTHQVVVSGAHWLDVMAPQANKGAAIRHIQQSLHITRDQTMVFGDYLNDMEMMDESTYSFAMANAHPILKARANFLSPGNDENGVVRTIKSVLEIK